MLWLDIHRPALAVQDPAVLRRFAVGTEIGELAKGLLGRFVDVKAYAADGRPDIPAMLRNTKKYLAWGRTNICEAAFSKNGCYCAVDILHRAGDGYEIYEVKSGTEVKEVYLQDVAYQRYVLEQSGLRISDVYIVTVNGAYVRQGDLDIRSLFAAERVSERAAPYLAEVAENVARARAYAARVEEPDMPLQEGCNAPYPCVYWQYCSRGLPHPNVFDLYGMHFSQACGYMREGIVSYADVAAGGIPLGPVQRRQVEAELQGLSVCIDRIAVRRFLEELHEPLYFLYIASLQAAVPLYGGTRPYGHIPFGYSLCRLQGGVHQMLNGFLGDGNGDPRRALAEQLAEDIPAGARILVYDRPTESRLLRELAEAFPDLSARLLGICENMRGLTELFQSGAVYSRALEGQFWLRQVMEAFFSQGQNDLGGSAIADDDGAADAYLSLQSAEGEPRARLCKDLRADCEWHTAALVALHQKLYELSV